MSITHGFCYFKGVAEAMGRDKALWSLVLEKMSVWVER